MRLRTEMSGMDRLGEALAGAQRRAADLSRPLTRLGMHMQRKNVRILRSGERGIRSRGMAGLAAAQTFRVAPPAQLEVGANKVYAASTNYGPSGGYYLPVRADHLAIPILDNLTAAGRARYVSPRDVPGGTSIVGFSRRGNILIGQRIINRKTGRAGRRSRIGRQSVGGTLLERAKVLFVLVDRSPQSGPAQAYHWCTFDPEDNQVWGGFVRRWILLER